MIQITDKMFAVEVEKEAHGFNIEKFPTHAWLEYKHTLKECIIKTNTNLDGNYDLLMNCKILGTVDKDTIDFDCEQLLYNIGYFYDGNEENRVEASHKMFRSLLASKNILFENPLEVPPAHIDFTEEWEEYDRAESQLVKKILIIEKI